MKNIGQDLQDAYYTSIKKNKDVFISILTDVPDSIIPDHLKTEKDQILDISTKAVRNIDFGSDYVEFKARFGNKIETISLPYDAIICMIEGD